MVQGYYLNSRKVRQSEKRWQPADALAELAYACVRQVTAGKRRTVWSTDS